MLLLQGIRKNILFLAIVLVLSIFADGASAERAAFWNGDIKKGEVSVRTVENTREAAIDEVIAAIGIAPKYTGNEIAAVMDGQKAEFWYGSDIARSAGKIVSLGRPVDYADGHWWCNAEALATAMNYFSAAIGKPSAFGWKEGSAPVNDSVVNVPLVKPAVPAAPAVPATPEINALQQETPATTDLPTTVTYHATLTDFKFTGKRRPIVVVDAGHGGHDPGAAANNVREKDINLKSALRLGELLASAGLDVRLTRTTDVFLKLGERTRFANTNKADVFISMHCNAMPKGKTAVSGIEYYIMAEPRDRDALNLAIAENKEVASGISSSEQVKQSDKKTQLLLKILGDMQQNDKINESTALTEELNTATRAASMPVRKVAQAPFFVLRGAAMPAVLVEMGYLTNASDAAKLRSDSYRDALCTTIANGIIKYIREHSNS